MRLIISLASLFLSVILLQLATGGIGPFDALSGFALGFTTKQIGLLGSSHFLGFFIGCFFAPRIIGTVGHSRCFAAFTSIGAIALIAHMIIISPYAWAVMRIGSGICVAGCVTVVESWLNAKAVNQNRARMMSSYRIIDLTGSLFAQLFIGILEPASYISYNILALLCCATLLPITLTSARQPKMPDTPKLRPSLALKCSPLAVLGVIVAALSAASFRMVGPIYAQSMGLEVKSIAYFLAVFVLGGALAQYPAGYFADKYNRRIVLIILSLLAVFSCILTALIQTSDPTVIMLLAGFFGFTTFPIFSISAAHAHDFASNEERVELSAALMFFFAVGAIAAPYFASFLMTLYGSSALFYMIAVGHLVLIVYSIIRMRARPTVKEKTPYIYAPRTSFIIGKLFKNTRDKRIKNKE